MNVPFVRLREVVVGKTGTKNPAAAPNVEFTYIDVAGVDNVAKQISEPKVMLGSDAPSRARKLIKVGDVIVSTIRPNLNAVAQVPDFLDGQVASTGFCVLRSTDKVLPAYLFYFVRSSSFVASLCGLVAGALYPAVTDNQVLDQLIPLPPIADQQLIVDFLSRAESIVRLRREAQQKAAELVPAIFLEMFGDPLSNPKGFSSKRLGAYLDIKSTVKLPDLIADAHLPCIGADSIESATGKIVTWPTVGEIRPISGKYFFEPADVLYSKIRPALRKVIIAPVSGYCSADMYPLRVDSAVAVPEYVASLLLSNAFTKYAIGVSARAQMPKVNRETLFAYEHPMPPLSQQQVFAKRAQQIASIAKQQVDATSKAEATFQALLSREFEISL